MKNVLILVFMTLSFAAYAQVSLPEARKMYFGMDKNECNALTLSKAFETSPPKDPLLIAYYGASAAASPACISNPAKKLSNFKNGKQLLETAVQKSSDNLEIRFLRFSTQSKAPSFLGYNANLKEDKLFILNNLKAFGEKKVNEAIQRQIGMFLLNSEELTPEEKSGVKKIIN